MAIIIQNPNIKKSGRSLTDNNRQTIGIKLPLTKGNVDGYFDSADITIDAVKENIRNLLLTRKGERVLNPTLGVGLESLLFENITDEIIELAKESIISAIRKWLPYITVGIVNISASTDNLYDNMVSNQNAIHINVSFYMNKTPNMMESVQVVLK